ncbi:MAG TPA: hypothetical protein PKH77_23970, partial [Anaerolineae bacterium]|nr:hypothetical protein [Anaerolineae bacterium]
ARGDKVAQAASTHADTAGRVLLRALKAHAPRKTGKFAEGLFYCTYHRPGGYEVAFYAGGEHGYLLPFLTNGAADHLISGTYPLRFFWERGPQGAGVYHYHHVHHPGANPSPFVAQARTATAPQVREELRQLVQLAWL